MNINEKNIDWEDIENKISLICYRFSNLEPWHDDLAQELRIHAIYKSTDYYDLYRKAIDFWRKIQTNYTPELPFFDLDALDEAYKNDTNRLQFDESVKLIRKELNRPGYNKWDNDMLEVARMLLDIIVSDIDPTITCKVQLKPSDLNHYQNKRLSLSWVSESTGIGYKRVVGAMKFLEETVQGLAVMHKIDIPAEFLANYYK